jgi:small subunit ribosomal protein S1
MDDFLAAIDETIKYFNDGDIVEGTIVKVDRDEVLLDIGYKTEGVIPSRELSIKHDVDPNEVVSVGDSVEALVLQKEDKEGRLILSKKRAQYERAWGTIEKIKEEDGIVTGTVIEVVKGGLILDIGLRGFLPASLVEMRRVRDLQPYVGKELEAKIIELDKNRNNVVLSRRQWLEQTQSEVRSTFLATLQKGQVRSGVVSSIVNFGAFVDLGGVDGLVHVSELSWKHIDHPSEVVEVGQEVTVEVLDVDLDRERVSLSLKATQEDPWQQFARTHAIAQVVPGKVTKLVPFGAFVRVDEGIEGLVHISELAERHVEIPEQVVNVGDELLVKVIDIDLERRRISLSLKQANEGGVQGEARSTRRSTAWPPATTPRASTSTPRASTRRPASGCPASRTPATRGRSSTPTRRSASRPTRSRSSAWRRRTRRRPCRPPTPPAPTAAATTRSRPTAPRRPPSGSGGVRRHAGLRRGPAGPAREALGRRRVSTARRRRARTAPVGRGPRRVRTGERAGAGRAGRDAPSR